MALSEQQRNLIHSHQNITSSQLHTTNTASIDDAIINRSANTEETKNNITCLTTTTAPLPAVALKKQENITDNSIVSNENQSAGDLKASAYAEKTTTVVKQEENDKVSARTHTAEQLFLSESKQHTDAACDSDKARQEREQQPSAVSTWLSQQRQQSPTTSRAFSSTAQKKREVAWKSTAREQETFQEKSHRNFTDKSLAADARHFSSGGDQKKRRQSDQKNNTLTFVDDIEHINNALRPNKQTKKGDNPDLTQTDDDDDHISNITLRNSSLTIRARAGEKVRGRRALAELVVEVKGQLPVALSCSSGSSSCCSSPRTDDAHRKRRAKCRKSSNSFDDEDKSDFNHPATVTTNFLSENYNEPNYTTTFPATSTNSTSSNVKQRKQQKSAQRSSKQQFSANPAYSLRHIPTSRSYLLEHLLLWGREQQQQQQTDNNRDLKNECNQSSLNALSHGRPHSAIPTINESTKDGPGTPRKSEEKVAQANDSQQKQDASISADKLVPPLIHSEICNCCRHRIRRRQRRRLQTQHNDSKQHGSTKTDHHHLSHNTAPRSASAGDERKLHKHVVAAAATDVVRTHDGKEVNEAHSSSTAAQGVLVGASSLQSLSTYHSQLHNTCRKQCRYLPFDLLCSKSGDDFVVFQQQRPVTAYNESAPSPSKTSPLLNFDDHDICQQCSKCKADLENRPPSSVKMASVEHNSFSTEKIANHVEQQKSGKKHHHRQHRQQEEGGASLPQDGHQHKQRHHRHHHHRTRQNGEKNNAQPSTEDADATLDERIALTKRMFMPARLRWPAPDRLVEDDEKRLIDLPQQHVKHASQEHEQRTVKLAPTTTRVGAKSSNTGSAAKTTRSSSTRFEYDDGDNDDNSVERSHTPLYVRPQRTHHKHRHRNEGEKSNSKPAASDHHHHENSSKVIADESASRRLVGETTEKGNSENANVTVNGGEHHFSSTTHNRSAPAASTAAKPTATTNGGRLIEEVIVHHTTISETLKTSLDETYLVTPLRKREPGGNESSSTAHATKNFIATKKPSRHQHHHKSSGENKRPESATTSNHIQTAPSSSAANATSRPKSAAPLISSNNTDEAKPQQVFKEDEQVLSKKLSSSDIQADHSNSATQQQPDTIIPESALAAAAPKIDEVVVEKVIVLQVEVEDDLATNSSGNHSESHAKQSKLNSLLVKQQQLVKDSNLSQKPSQQNLPYHSTTIQQPTAGSAVSLSSPKKPGQLPLATNTQPVPSAKATDVTQVEPSKAQPISKHPPGQTKTPHKTEQTNVTTTMPASNGVVLSAPAENNAKKASVVTTTQQQAALPSVAAANQQGNKKSHQKTSDILVTKTAVVTVKNERGVRGERSSKRAWTQKRIRLEKLKLTISPESGDDPKQIETLDLRNSFAELADDYKKRPNVFRLNMFDGGVKLVQAENKEECKAWIEAVNINCAMSLPPRLSLSLEADFDSSDLEKLRNNRTNHATLDQHFETLRKHVDAIRELQDRVPDTDRDPDFEDMTWSDFLKMELKKTRVYLRRLEKFL